MLAILDGLLVALPCCSPVQRLDRMYAERRSAREPEMPGVTYFTPDGDLFLGIGDFVVFSVFSSHAVRAGVAPLAAVAVSLLVAVTITMAHAALSWPNRSLTPVLPSSISLAALLLAAERVAIRPSVEAVAVSVVML